MQHYLNSTHIPSPSLSYCSGTMTLLTLTPDFSSVFRLWGDPHRSEGNHHPLQKQQVPHFLILPSGGNESQRITAMGRPERRPARTAGVATLGLRLLPPASCQVCGIGSCWKRHPLPCRLSSHLWPLAAPAQQCRLSSGETAPDELS